MSTYSPGAAEANRDGAEPPFTLPAGETVLAVFRPDLDERLAYAPAVVALTTTHLRYRDAKGGETSWPLGPALTLRRAEHHGLGELTVLDGETAVACFRFTLREQAAAVALADAFETHVHGAPKRRRDHAPPETEDELPPSNVGRVRFPLGRLLAFARPHLRLVSLGIFLTLASTALGLVPPYLTMPLVDDVLTRPTDGGAPPYGKVAFYLAALGVSAVLAWLLGWAQGYVISRVGERIAADLRVRTFSHLTRLSLEYFGGKRTGDLISRISTDTEHLCSFLSDTLVDFVTDVLMITGTAVVLVWLDPGLAFAALGSFPFIAWLIAKVRARLTSGFLRGSRVWSGMTNILADTIPGIRVVKAFSQERREIERFSKANARIVRANDRVNALWTFFWPLVGFLNQIGLLVVWAVGAYQVLGHRITIGVLTAFIAYIGRFYARVESMSRMLTATERASAGAERLFEILDRVPSVADPKHPVKVPELTGRIAFEHVSFRYGSRLVLDDVSFEVPPNTLVGVVGHTGSGKSTVANLLCRFYDVESGRVTVDGVDIRSLSLDEYRKHIGIVLQDAFLFFGTVAENVAYGSPGATRARIVESARGARAHDFVLRLPEAYDAIVGERGQSLSGGERQRLAIARALLVDPKILVLDEATSAVDVRTEREIQRALDAVMVGRTTIAIAHRVTTLDRADLVIVLRDGVIVEKGTRAELLAADGEYARLRRSQAKGAVAEEASAEDTDFAAPVPLVPVSSLELARDPSGRLVAWDRSDPSGKTAVRVRRCFPLSDPEHFVSLVEESGAERACIEDPSLLPAPLRALVDEELRRTDFLPSIRRIDGIVREATRATWTVETDRGARTFVVEHEDSVRRLEDGRYLVTDSDGMRYVVPAGIPPASRKLLARVS
ncbi:MAG TPA: DUF1854 domain-containing protein [Polyangiaceae bacterium]|nr:DUF1854 domain-containing protein [Polyangiaceae bacterium]